MIFAAHTYQTMIWRCFNEVLDWSLEVIVEKGLSLGLVLEVGLFIGVWLEAAL